MKYNIVAKFDKDKPYIMYEMMATNLNKKDFEKVQKLNMEKLSEYRFIPYNETDFSWWIKISKFLTKRKIYKNTYFKIDYFGNITKY